MLTQEAAGLQPMTKKNGRLDLAEFKALEIPLNIFIVFSEYMYCWMFIFMSADLSVS